MLVIFSCQPYIYLNIIYCISDSYFWNELLKVDWSVMFSHLEIKAEINFVCSNCTGFVKAKDYKNCFEGIVAKKFMWWFKDCTAFQDPILKLVTLQHSDGRSPTLINTDELFEFGHLRVSNWDYDSIENSDEKFVGRLSVICSLCWSVTCINLNLWPHRYLC